MTTPPAVEVNGLLQRLLDFVAALRRAGVGTTQSEAIDACRALAELDLLDRSQLREGLAAVTVTSPSRRPAFDDLFDVYFPARPAAVDDTPMVTDEVTEQPESEEVLDDIRDALSQDDEARVRHVARQAVETFGRVEGHDGSSSYFQYRVFRAVDVQHLLRDMLRQVESDRAGEPDPLEQRLARDAFQQRGRAFRAEVEAEVRRRAAAQRGLEHVAQRLTRPAVEELDFVRLSAEDQAQMRAQIRPLA